MKFAYCWRWVDAQTYHADDPLRGGDAGSFGRDIGVALGAIGVQMLGTTPAIRGLLKPDLGIALLGLSVLIAVAVGIISGLYPAWRSSRLNPESCLAERMRSAHFNRSMRNYSGIYLRL